jgi:hypothetical protein
LRIESVFVTRTRTAYQVVLGFSFHSPAASIRRIIEPPAGGGPDDPEWAGQNSYTVVTADSDFAAMVSQTGPPPRFVPIERCDFPFRAIEELLRQNAIRISEFEKDPNSRLLVLRPPPLKQAGNIA